MPSFSCTSPRLSFSDYWDLQQSKRISDYLGMPIQEKLFYYEIKFWIFPTKCLQHTLVAHVDEMAVFLSGYIFSKSELHMYLEIYSSHTKKNQKNPHNFTVEDFIQRKHTLTDKTQV